MQANKEFFKSVFYEKENSFYHWRSPIDLHFIQKNDKMQKSSFLGFNISLPQFT